MVLQAQNYRRRKTVVRRKGDAIFRQKIALVVFDDSNIRHIRILAENQDAEMDGFAYAYR